MTPGTLRRSISDWLVADRGYTRSGRSHKKAIRPDFELIVDIGPLDGPPHISPWIGIRSEAGGRLQAELLELPNDPYVATIGDNVGAIIRAGYLGWQGNESMGEVQKAIDDAARVMAEYATLPKLVEWAQRLDYITAVPLLLLLGDRTQAEAWLARAKQSECAQPDALCDQFRRFERNARSHPTLTDHR